MVDADVDVVIPTIGRSSLDVALASVRAQTVPVRNTIVVLDDPSLRDSVEARLDGETLVVTAGRVGGGRARNIGLEASEAPYVSYLDDDDWWEPTKIEVQIAAMRAADAALSFTETAFHTERGVVRRLPRRPRRDTETVADYLVSRERLEHGDGYLQSSSLTIDRDRLGHLRWDTDLPKHQDWDYVIRLAALAEPLIVPEVLVHVRQGSSGSVSRTRNWRASARVYEKHRNSFSPAGAGDFLFTQVVRGALAGPDLGGLRYVGRRFRVVRPNPAAVVVGAAGLVEGLRARIAR